MKKPKEPRDLVALAVPDDPEPIEDLEVGLYAQRVLEAQEGDEDDAPDLAGEYPER